MQLGVKVKIRVRVEGVTLVIKSIFFSFFASVRSHFSSMDEIDACRGIIS